MRGIGDHCCETCGKMYDTVGDYQSCVESHDNDYAKMIRWEGEAHTLISFKRPIDSQAHAVVEFHSEDVGCTQGTTLYHLGEVLIRYKPGTGHWPRALEIATEYLTEALNELVPANLLTTTPELRARMVTVLQRHRCTIIPEGCNWFSDDEPEWLDHCFIHAERDENCAWCTMPKPEGWASGE